MLDNWCARSASLLPGTVQDVFQAHVRGTSGGNRIDLLTFWKGAPQTVRTPPMALLHCASTVPGTPCRYVCPSPACTPFHLEVVSPSLHVPPPFASSTSSAATLPLPSPLRVGPSLWASQPTFRSGTDASQMSVTAPLPSLHPKVPKAGFETRV